MQPDERQRYSAYVICTSPRSGSTLLCSLLAATRVAGKPESYFHEPDLARWAADLGVAPEGWPDRLAFLSALLQAAVSQGRAGSAVFGLRLQRRSAGFLLQQLAVLHPGAADDRQRLEAAFGRTLFIHLTRADKLAQAVSCVRAEQTGLWHRAADGSELERLKPHQDPVYDGAEIRRCREEMQAWDRAWLAWFAAQGIQPLTLTYDALAADPAATLRRVLRALGLPEAAADGVAPGVRKLADATSQAWTRRFLAEFREQPPA